MPMNKTLYTKNQTQLIEKLKKARKEAGLTQVQVAKKLKATQAYISKIEAGQVRLDIFQLKRFAKIYKKDISIFM